MTYKKCWYCKKGIKKDDDFLYYNKKMMHMKCWYLKCDDEELEEVN